MVGLKEYLTAEETRLEKIKEIVDVQLENVPGGSLRISSTGKFTQYMHCTEKNGIFQKQGEYLKKEEIGLARELAQKTYNQKIKKIVDKRLRQIQTLNKDYSDEEIAVIYDRLIPKRKALINPVEEPWEQKVSRWKSIPYNGKGFKEGTIEIYSKKGERVRSKSEKILADMFYDRGIEYKYECPLMLKGYGIVYPDFTFLSKKTHKEIYWEHDGRMDDPEYAEKAIKKVDLYTKNGILPGQRLIVTFETSNYALNTAVAEQLICEYLI
ncbi:hypothetical protein [Butyrivibrio sp. JL13D10]|uniref:hypothetical protein n=1 Tax=Butyrivibrio sp. JL13D10 TaxID=3236815 RepID=UPI0038B4CCBA